MPKTTSDGSFAAAVANASNQLNLRNKTERDLMLAQVSKGDTSFERLQKTIESYRRQTGTL